MRRARVAILAATVLGTVVAVVASACPSVRPPAVAVSAPSAPPLRGKPRTNEELATTSADIFLENLDGQIGELERLVREQPKNVANLKRLASDVHLRARFHNDPREIARGIALAGDCVALAPRDAGCFLLRAEGLQSIHRFAAARADLESAKALGAEPSRVRAMEADLDWNDGRYELAIPAIREARRRAPSTATWIREAQLEHDLGHEAQADAAFERAEDAIADTSPLVVAHLNLQRGIQKMQTGRLDEACTFFREAIARVPDHVAANEHLAETLHLMGKNAEATSIYEKVVRLSEDPELVHALAKLRREAGDTKAADALEAEAKVRYEALLVAFPEAMYWHASEFFLETGDPKRARELLRKNVVLRPNGTSYAALAFAEHAAGDHEAAKIAIERALAMPVVSASLFTTAFTIASARGDASHASDYRARALAIDPAAFRDDANQAAAPP